MAIKVDNCCGCFNTKTGTIIIGSINLALSIIYLIFFVLYLALVVLVGTNAGVADHTIFIVVYVFLGIGILAALLQIFFCVMLIRGVQRREPKWVRVYMIIGTVSLFFGLLSLVLGSLNIVAIIWAIIVVAVQIYFLIVIHSEYKNILAEKESQNVGESPETQKPVGFR